MSHRIPLLEMIDEDFKGYQKIILTYDENWFSVMNMKFEGKIWEFKKLFIQRVEQNGEQFDQIIATSSDFLEWAKIYRDNGDLKLSAAYLRTEFEKILKKYANNKKKKILYKLKPEKVGINEFWNVIKDDIDDENLKKDVEAYRSILLNPAVHYDQRQVYTTELNETIKVVERLENELF